MSEPILVAFITLVGSGIGTIGGILASSKLTNHRLEQLEKKVEKHNNIVERTYKLEGQMRETEHDIMEMKGKK
ncbi:hypothetical protein [Vagococcus fluvialis]|uniref:hypothetical protein n=1 Tax=Vagococcus fluvialis TaxID=2738 RepID=UPI001D0A3E04|nr:hypothetical protein [Vagococcus fluvialis]UDM79611.1 hypothetical protein K5K97_13100 [Vagococcus fluvialis]